MRRYKITFVLALSILLGCVCSAQQTPTTSVPNLIRYSASLKDGQGATLPPNTPVGVTFAIYNQQDGGAPIWQETQNVTPDANGQYTVLLGTTTSTGLPDDLFSQQEQRWLGVQLQGQSEQPRVMMVSVPYAFKAHEAETLGGLPASAFVKAPPTDVSGGSDVSGTASSAQAASTTGNSTGNKTKSGGGGPDTVVNCTTAKNNYLPIFTAAAPPNITICNSVVYQAGSNIGIGTTTPVATLDVNGAINSSQYYQILGTTVLAIPGYSGGSENLSVGAGTGGTLSKTGNLPPPSTGTNNTFLGILAGSSNTSGSYGTFIGDEAGIFNTTGSQNTYTGYTAGYGNTTGMENSCYGSAACLHNLTGNFNVAVGVGAGFRNTAGSSNTYLGFDAGWGNTIQDLGSNNTITGYEAGFGNTANNGSFYGYKAGYNNTADGNSFFGYNSGTANTTGIQNVFNGYQTGLANTTGGSNVFIGYNAGQSNVDQSYNTFLGANAGFSSNVGGNTLLGYSAGSNTNSGYGIVATGYDAGRSNTTGLYNSYFGANAGFGGSGSPATTGYGNTYVGTGAGSSSSLTNGGNNTFLGYNAGNNEANVNNSIEIGNSGLHVGDGTIAIGVQGLQSMKTYIAGIYEQTSLSNTRSVVIDSTGHLGTGTGGGGGIGGGCNSPGSYLLTKWLTSGTVQCSSITELANTFVGIGTATPARQLDVSGEVNANHYEIGDKIVVSIDGTDNTLIGDGPSNATGTENTIVGKLAGAQNTGSNNVFEGFEAGVNNKAGGQNTFLGAYAGLNNAAGNANTFVGYGTGNSFSGGSGNIFIGSSTANNNTTSSNDIYLGNSDCGYPCTESGVIRIGSQSIQTSAYMAGIYGRNVATGTAELVYIDSTGKLGTVPMLQSEQAQQDSAAGQQDTIKALQSQVQTQAQQIADLQQRLSRLESMMEKK